MIHRHEARCRIYRDDLPTQVVYLRGGCRSIHTHLALLVTATCQASCGHQKRQPYYPCWFEHCIPLIDSFQSHWYLISGCRREIDCSELEAVAEFGIELARVVEVESAKGEGVVEQDATIGDVGCGDRGGDVFGDGLADGEIEGGVEGEVLVWIGSGGVGCAVMKARAVVDVGGGVGMRGKGGVEAEVEGVRWS